MTNLLPRPHLSASQITLALEKPDAYRRRYLLNERGESSVQMAFGSDVTAILEGRVEGEKNLVEQLKNIPRFTQTNVKLLQEIRRKKEKVDVLAYLDAWEDNHILDYKTHGETSKWSVRRLEDDEQFRLYSLLKWKETGIIPKVTIIAIPTEKVFLPVKQGLSNGENFALRIKDSPMMFSTTYSLATLLKSEARVWRAYEIITKMYKEHLYGK